MRKKITILLTGFLVLSFALTGCGDTTSPQTGENEPDTEAKTDKKDTTDNNTTRQVAAKQMPRRKLPTQKPHPRRQMSCLPTGILIRTTMKIPV